jgi:predicted Rossmann fold flavoprotein
MQSAIDVAVIGGGAAGLFAAIWAARKNPDARIVVLDGAKRIGAKILIAGGGRCNVTHHHVDEKAFAGSSPAAIRKILRRFDVDQTVAFFQSLGVELKREPTGKLFPVSDRAKTVLDALLRASESANVAILTSRRVRSVSGKQDDFWVSEIGEDSLREESYLQLVEKACHKPAQMDPVTA